QCHPASHPDGGRDETRSSAAKVRDSQCSIVSTKAGHRGESQPFRDADLNDLTLTGLRSVQRPQRTTSRVQMPLRTYSISLSGDGKFRYGQLFLQMLLMGCQLRSASADVLTGLHYPSNTLFQQPITRPKEVPR